MTDPIQYALHSAATQSPVLTVLAVFCAVRLLFVLVAQMAVQGVLNLSRLTWTVAARVVVSLAVATLLTLPTLPTVSIGTKLDTSFDGPLSWPGRNLEALRERRR